MDPRTPSTSAATLSSMSANEDNLEGRRAIKLTTIEEARDAVASSRHPVNVIVLPPTAGDSGDDVSDTEYVPDDPEEEFEPAGELEVEEEVDTEEVPRQRTSKKARVVTPLWKKTDQFDRPLPSTQIPPSDEIQSVGEMSAFEVWKKFFSDAMVEHIVIHTNLYARRDCNNKTFGASKKDIENFLGIVMLSGYHSLPHVQHYWSTQPDMGVPLVYNTMSRNRFIELKKYIHFADNQKLTKGDKLSKVTPLYDMLNKLLAQFGVFHSLLSVDEAMVPYFGRHSAKMFIRGKPIRFGYKIWMLCGNDGYPYHMSIYQGKDEQASKEPLGTRVVMKMVDFISANSAAHAHELYFDNFFTSYDLLVKLADNGMRATGTVRQNRVAGATASMLSDTALIKKGRGSFDYRSDGKVYVAKWNDNSLVTVASNWQTHNPVHKSKRRIEGQRRDINQPDLIRSYNNGMGGVDLLDRLSSAYRPSIRGKKWYWPLFVNILNVATVAAWRIHCKATRKSLTHLEFRRQVVLCLLQGDRQEERTRARLPAGELSQLPDIRYDGINHTLGTATQGRCRVCQRNTKNICQKCNVRLHAERGKQNAYRVLKTIKYSVCCCAKSISLPERDQPPPFLDLP
ncbi:PiggyBac transposable element-derived protein 3 [Trichinella papuae]|uniref:PiggyBac transposable element-derived protein 3 n=1 Tax=Trichinella papuae TaxID=268474 RepID=A0A0V1MHI4_9BILA|nr:PiggyBac transposable element-derived protein 3 [Trichinella papuae]